MTLEHMWQPELPVLDFANTSLPMLEPELSPPELPAPYTDTAHPYLPGLELINATEFFPTGEANPVPQPPFEAAADGRSMTAVGDEVLAIKLGDLERAIADGDKKEIKRILETLAEDDLKSLNQLYAEKHEGQTASAAIGKRFSGREAVELSSIFFRADARTNDAGQLAEAIAAKSPRQIIETLATLNSSQLATLAGDYKSQSGVDIHAVLGETKLSEAQKQFVNVLLGGSDKRTTEDNIALAKLAVREADVDLLHVALRGQAASPARQRLQSDQEFQTLLREKTVGYQSFGELDVVQDILREGHISLISIVEKNDFKGFSPFGLFGSDNQDNVELALEHATEEERRNFSLGEEIADKKFNGNLKPGDKELETLTYEERTGFDYYRRLHKSLDSLGNDHELVKWEAMLTDPNGSVVEALAEAYGDRDEFFRTAEELSENEWLILKDTANGKAYREDIERSLNRFAKPDEAQRVLDIIDGKAREKGVADASEITRSIFDVIDDAKNSKRLRKDSFDEDDIVTGILRMNGEEREKVKNDAQFRKKVLDRLSGTLSGREESLAGELLDQIVATGERPKLSPAQQFIYDRITDADYSNQTQHLLEALEDETFRNRIKEGKDLQAVEKEFKEELNGFLKDGLGNPLALHKIGGDIKETLLNEGRIPPAVLLDLGLDREFVFERLHQFSEPERTEALDRLKDDEKTVARFAIDQKGLLIEDRIRTFVLGEDELEPSLKAELGSLSDAELIEAKKRYATKYGEDLDNQLLDSVDGKEYTAFLELLRPGISDGRQQFYDNLQRENGLTGHVQDGTEATVTRAIQLNAELLQDFQSRFEQLPKEAQDEVNRLFQEALEDYKVSKAAYAERIINIALIVGGVGLSVTTAGVSLSLLPAVFAAGAIGQIAVKRYIEGSDFDTSFGSLLKEGIIGGSKAALSVIGPETVASTLAVGRTAAREAVQEAVLRLSAREPAQIFKSNAEQILTNRIDNLVSQSVLKGQPVTPAEVKKLATEITAEGLTPDKLKTVEDSITFALENKGREIAEVAFNELSRGATTIREAGGWSIIEGSTNAVTELTVDSANGQLDLTGIPSSFIQSAREGASFRLSLKIAGRAASETKDVLRVGRGQHGEVTLAAAEGKSVKGEFELSDGTKVAIELTDEGTPIPEGARYLKVENQKIERATLTTDVANLPQDIAASADSYIDPVGKQFLRDGNLSEVAYTANHGDVLVLKKVGAKPAWSSETFPWNGQLIGTPRAQRISFGPDANVSYFHDENRRLYAVQHTDQGYVGRYLDNAEVSYRHEVILKRGQSGEFVTLSADERLENVSESINLLTEKFSRGSLPADAFDNVASRFSPEDRPLVESILLKSENNSSDIALSQSLQSVSDDVKAALGVDYLSPEEIYTTGPDSAGNLTGYLFRKSNKYRAGIKTLDQLSEDLSQRQAGSPILIFDKPSSLSESDIALLKKHGKEHPIVFVDANNFEKGANVLDFASGPDVVDLKLQGLLEESRQVKALHPDWTDDQIAEEVLNGAENRHLESLGLNAKIVRPERVDHTGVSEEAIATFIAKYPPHQQKELADLLLLSDYKTFGQLSEDLTTLKAAVDQDAINRGIDLAQEPPPLYVVGVDAATSATEPASGSGALIAYLYKDANGIPSEQFVTPTQLKALKDKGDLTYVNDLGETRNRRIIYVDDTIYTGQQTEFAVSKVLTDYPDVTVATLGAYSPWLKYVQAPSFVPPDLSLAHAHFVHLAAHFPQNPSSDPFFKSLTPDRKAIRRALLGNDGSFGSLSSFQIFPYMTPDTSANFIKLFGEQVLGVHYPF